MAKVPAIAPLATIRALEQVGFEVVRIKGSHHVMKRESHRPLIVVPVHRGNLARRTLRQIIRASGLTVEEFVELL